MRKYVAVLALIFALAIYVAIQDQSSAAKFAKQGTTQTDTVSAADTHNNHPPKNTEDTKWNPPGWHRLFAWPEGITTWAIILTLLAVAEQARESAKATQAVRDSIPLQQQTADAAKLNAEAFIKSERAWVVTRIEFTKGNIKEGSTYDGHGAFVKTTLNVVLICRNDGNTPAWILEQTMWCRTHTEAPPHKPDTTDPSFVDHGFQPISIGRQVETKASIESSDHREAFSGRVTILYAVVKYKDAFGPHETWCGYLIRGDLGHGWLERLTGYEEYNRYS
jgi:hypothetical protein